MTTECDIATAADNLFAEIAKGEASAAQGGWIDEREILREFNAL